MTDYEAEIKRHAEEEQPRECCGLLCRSDQKGQLRVVRTQNIALDSEHNFEIPAQDYFRAKESGTLVGAYHSHVTDTADFTDSDKQISEIAQLPYWLYSLQERRFNVYKPSGYKTPLTGRDFCLGIFDCCTLVIDYYDQKLGIQMPYFEHDLSSMTTGHKTFRKYLESNKFLEVDRTELRLHDIIVMSLNGLGTENHAGIYIGNFEMLHHALNRQSGYTPYTNTYWHKHTVLAYRYEG